MQNIFKLAAITAMLASTTAHAELAINANLELDTTYTNEVEAPARNARASDVGLGGRVEFNAGAKATNGDAYVSGRASLLMKKDGNTGIDDLWVQFGNSNTDLKLGRFEAMDLFPLGKDTVVEEAGYSAYKANALRGRFGSDTVHAALGINAGSAVRVELGLVQSKDDGNAKGFRPAVSYSAGALTLRAGVESVKVVGMDGSQTGFGVSAGYKVSESTGLNLNFAKKEDDKTFGFNAVIGAAGIGVIAGKGATSADKVTTVYVAYSLPLMGVKGATITPALSYSKGGTGTDDQIAARVRINYAF